MFKKLLIVSSLSLLAACSSQSDEDYATDVVISSNSDENSGNEVVGKTITPVNLIEQNLSLTESNLFVTVKNSDDPEKNKSTIDFSIEYTTANSEDSQTAKSTYNVVVINSDKIEDKLQALILEKDAEKEKLKEEKGSKNKKKKNKKEEPAEVVVEKPAVETLTLESDDGSQSCSDDTCKVTQTISFDVDTQQLLDAQENGFVFLLKPNEGEAFIETMIPASYLQSLLVDVKSMPENQESMDQEAMEKEPVEQVSE